ncbi:phthalate 3,4-dioxygenase, ferredoxin reductase subunit [Pseudonocardia ammonioxydans]|uniref:Phthalate 3,4-dioxygenase, ferredoxin reductase subunit n=1 Tax=Pseudonocardia ammonioxydans TaxID=260086 RepID=A0A1I5I4R9_PSUAM|nr:FAD-dependent oxidoreductase [Pseudonocardia ammonioxydans]SFO55638.1 phthalate 3,4-dioxygenase, ferredoxin reductase subunit [Pseudonocardia ammonioxydans]
MARTVIVGASVGGVRTAQALRAAEYEGEIVLVGDENVLPYDKPPLSKALLAGTTSVDNVGLLTREAAAQTGIELRLGSAAVGVADGAVRLADGTELPYDDLVIATGARARPSPWGTPPGVHVVRSLDDAHRLGTALRAGGPLVVIGAGFIGAEVAATALGMGLTDVTVVDPVAVPLSRVLNEEVAGVFGDLHAGRGVTTRFGVGVTDVREAGGALEVVLDDGSVLPAATIVVGIGAIPNDEWLAHSGIPTDGGVLCDSHCSSVEAPHVWAVGDVARWWHPVYDRYVRLEHWTNAVEQAVCVAHNITHPEDLRSHAPVEYVWSDQYDWKIQLVGRTGGDLAHVRVDGADPARSFAVLYGDGTGRFIGALTVNWPKALVTCRRALSRPSTPPSTVGDVQGLLNSARQASRPTGAGAR